MLPIVLYSCECSHLFEMKNISHRSQRTLLRKIQQNLINSKFKGPKKVFWIIKNFYNSNKKLANLLEKLVLLLSVRYAATCHTIPVINHCFTWCGVVINVMFNTVKPLLIVSERTAKNKQWMWGSYFYFELLGKNCIITTGQILLLNYELNLYEGCKFN
jgi:hypothetical protein